MNSATSTRRRSFKPLDPRRWLLQQNAHELLQKLEAAAANPDPQVVHRLRTGTRRSGALLESLLAKPGRSAEFRSKQKKAHKLLCQWKKLRRAAGAVRDLDVHLGLVEKLEKAEARLQPSSEQLLHQQMQALKAWLRHQRARQAEALQQEAAKRLERCKRLTTSVLGAAPPPPQSSGKQAVMPSRRTRTPAALALEDFYSISEANPHLGEENLHDFRKSTKQARYVAEAGQRQPDAVAVDKALKRIQDAIGEWHDLDALQAESRTALGKNGRELERLLRDQADRKMALAVQSTERMRRRLLGERLALRSR